MGCIVLFARWRSVPEAACTPSSGGNRVWSACRILIFGLSSFTPLLFNLRKSAILLHNSIVAIVIFVIIKCEGCFYCDFTHLFFQLST